MRVNPNPLSLMSLKVTKGILEQTRKENLEEIKKDGTMSKPKIQALGETHPAQTRLLDLQPPDL